MRPKIIPKRDVPFVFATARWAHVQVMVDIVGFRPKDLASRDTQIATVLIAQIAYFGDYNRKLGRWSQEDINIDDGLGCKSGYPAGEKPCPAKTTRN
jgi:hypothetical protein